MLLAGILRRQRDSR